MPNGFAQLQAWLPDVVLDALNPHATLTSEAARGLIGTAISITLIALGVVAAAFMCGRLRDGLLGRSMVRKTGAFLAFVRKAALLVVIGAPWWAVWQMTQGGDPGKGIEAIGVFAALLWVGACAVDHSAIWLEHGDATIELRRGFAIFPIRRASIPLQELLLDSNLSHAPGPEA